MRFQAIIYNLLIALSIAEGGVNHVMVGSGWSAGTQMERNVPSAVDCYTIVTAVVWHGNPDYRIERVVSTGILQLPGAPGSAPTECDPGPLAMDTARRTIATGVKQRSVRVSSQVTYLELTTTVVERARRQLAGVEANACLHPDGFTGIELIALRSTPGGESKPIALHPDHLERAPC